jgi:hypothetical protein
MKLKKLLFFVVALLVSFQMWGNGPKKSHKALSTGCTLSAYASPTTIELGDSSNIYVSLIDSSTSSSSPSFTVVWSPSTSVTSPDSANTYAHPATATIYTVTITSSLCGTMKDSVTVNIGCSLTAGVTSTPYYCSADAGTATVTAANGVQPYTYSWSSGQTTSSVTGLTAGSYSVTVKDSNGCSVLDTFSIAATSFYITATANPTTIESGNSTSLQVNLYDSLSTSSSSVSYTVAWSPAASVANPTSATTNASPTTTTTYTVSVTTPCGVLTDTVTVFIGCTVAATVSTTPYYCSADAGSASVTPSGGIPPYSYSWSTGQTTSSITGVGPGTYSVTVKDSTGCSTVASYSIVHDTLTISATASPTTITAGDSTFLQVTVNDSLSTSSSSTSYTVTWTPATGVRYPDSASTYADPLVTTTYTVMVTTPCGSYPPITVTVTVNPPCVNTFVQQICVVSVDTALNKNIIIWGRNDSPPNGSFYIYDSLSSGWTLIGIVPDTALSEFIDSASNPNSGPVKYEIATDDSCGESAMSATQGTIYLQVKMTSGTDSLYWTAYVGFTPTMYYIYRGKSLGTLTLLDSVPSGTLTYIDTPPPGDTVYMIEAGNPSGGCTPTHRHTSPHSSDVNNRSFSNGSIPFVPTGINELSLTGNSFVVSPNPANGLFTLSYTLAKEEDITVSVIDEFGRTLYNQQFNEQHAGITKRTLDIQDLQNGIYSLKMTTADGIVVKKIVILKK